MHIFDYIFLGLFTKNAVGQLGCQTSYTSMAIDGNDLANVAGSTSACCQACQQHAGCAAYTWNSTNGGTCYLKTDTQPLYVSAGEFTVVMAPNSTNTYSLNTSYEGANFFDNFKFQLKNADCGCFVNYTDRNTSETLGLIEIKNNKIYMRVDNYTTLPPNSSVGRNSINIMSLSRYNSGLFILDIDHVPTGPGLWPAYWTYGPKWPNDGEIDILESVSINDSYRDYNQVSIHTYDTDGACGFSTNVDKYITGRRVTGLDCYSNHSVDHGCSVVAPNGTYNVPFNQNGGGVFAMEWIREKSIRVWNFVRSNIPKDILNNSPNPNPSSWGQPVSYLAIGNDCSANHFNEQAIIFDAAICGAAAGVFPGGESACEETVRSSPHNYSEAYWIVNYVKVYCRPEDPCRVS